MRAYIPDGYTVEFESLDPFLTALIRPVVGTARAHIRHRAKVSGGNLERYEQIKNEVIASQVLEWSLTDESEHPVPVSEEAADRLHPEAKERLFAEIMMNPQSDRESAKN